MRIGDRTDVPANVRKGSRSGRPGRMNGCKVITRQGALTGRSAGHPFQAGPTAEADPGDYGGKVHRKPGCAHACQAGQAA